MDVATVEFLLTQDGRELLQSAEAYDGDNAMSVSERLRASNDPTHVAAALSQVALRRRAMTKFGADAGVMLFTSDGLEQATHRRVARHRAGRCASSGATAAVDLGCGIGGDLVELRRAGLAVRGVDIDPVTARIAAANLGALGLTGEVEVGSATDVGVAQAELAFADPARREAGRRIFHPDAFSPPWSFVERLLAGLAAVKLAPGLPHEVVPDGVEAEWVSLDGQLRECVLWSPGLARVRRRATVLRSPTRDTEATDRIELTEVDEPGGEPPVRAVGAYVYEPDDAVIRAHLVTAFADRVRGWLLDPYLAYVSSDELVATGLGRAYRVVEVLPFREKPLRAALRARDVGALTIKKRGVQVTPETLRKRLGLKGSQPATLVITRTPGSAQALLVEPLSTVLPHQESATP